MKKTNSKRFEFDLRNLKDILYAVLASGASIYIANQEIMNNLLSNYIEKETLAVTIIVLVYSCKKYITNYNKPINT